MALYLCLSLNLNKSIVKQIRHSSVFTKFPLTSRKSDPFDRWQVRNFALLTPIKTSRVSGKTIFFEEEIGVMLLMYIPSYGWPSSLIVGARFLLSFAVVMNMRSVLSVQDVLLKLHGTSERGSALSQFTQLLTMGRTLRHRRKKLVAARPVPLGSDENYLRLVKWLMSQTWSPTCKLAPVQFAQTGRGMLAKENIPSNSILASLPASALITVRTVANSELSKVFLNTERSFSTQQVLSAFLVYQKHLGSDSYWLPYLNILPDQYYSPVFSPDEIVDAFPVATANKVYRMKAQIDELHLSLMEAMADKLCDHCHKTYHSIFSYEIFQWAWFTVNSRSVFLSPSVNDPCNVMLTDCNSLAMAPFLDMINHTDTAKVNVLYDDKNHLYSIQTLVPYKKHEEVFINYGGHSNEKLFLEYGFILPTNRNDSVTFTQDEFLQALKTVVPHLDVPKNRYNLLKSHGFLSNLSCGHDGLSWNARALLHVYFEPSTVDIGDILKAIYSSAFRLPGEEMMESIRNELFSHKINVYSRCVDDLKELSGGYACPNLTINTGIELLKKYIEILERNLNP